MTRMIGGLAVPEFVIGLRGYATDEVDAFLALAGEALAGGGSLSSADIPAVWFSIALRGYDRQQVDMLLDQIRQRLAEAEQARAVPAGASALGGGSTADVPVPPRGPVFARVPLFGKGYDRRQVDDLVARIRAVLAGGGGLVADDVAGAAFTLGRSGYDCEQVDTYLDQVVRYLRARQGA